MPKKVFRFVYAMNYIFQAAFCMLTPAALLIGGGWLLVHRCGVGNWAMISGIVLGVLMGMYSLFSFLTTTANHIDPTEQKGDASDGRKR